jgi:hypothetical protein
MNGLRHLWSLSLAILIVAAVSGLSVQIVRAKTCYGPGNIVVPCPPKEQPHPTKVSPPTATPTSTPLPTATATSVPVPGANAGGNNGGSPNQKGPTGFGGSLGWFVGLLAIAVAFAGGVAVGYISKPGSSIGGTRARPSVGLNASDLTNLAHQINPSGHVPLAHGADGSLDGLNRALNRAGLPGIGGDGYSNDGTENLPPGTNPNDPARQIPGDGVKGSPYQTGGFWTDNGRYINIYGYYDTAGEQHFLVAVVLKSKSDPVPDDDGTSGAGTLPLDGTGKVRPHGDVLDLNEEGPGLPADLHGDLSNLANLNEQANLGHSSSPGTQHGGATDPGGDSDNDNSADAGDLKQILDSYDATYDPSPEHPLSDSGKTTGP